MTSRVRSPPTSPYRMARVVDAGGPSRGWVITSRTRLAVLVVAVVVLVVLVISAWPDRYEDVSSDEVFEGEVWGDLTTVGDIWGRYDSEFERVDLRFWGSGGGDALRVWVSNVSVVSLLDRHDETNVSVPCNNGTFMIITSYGSVNVCLSDLEFSCVFREYTGTFPGEDEVYGPRKSVSFVEGHGHLTNGRAIEWYHHDGFELDGCSVIVDGFTYREVDLLLIPDGETAYIEVEGAVGPMGGMRVPGDNAPHVNGSLEIEDFLLKRGERSMMYDRIMFEGEDIFIRTTQISDFGTGGPFAWFDQWTVEVTLSEDVTVEAEPAPVTPWWVIAVLILLIIILCLAIVTTVHRVRSRNPI